MKPILMSCMAVLVLASNTRSASGDEFEVAIACNDSKGSPNSCKVGLRACGSATLEDAYIGSMSSYVRSGGDPMREHRKTAQGSRDQKFEGVKDRLLRTVDETLAIKEKGYLLDKDIVLVPSESTLDPAHAADPAMILPKGGVMNLGAPLALWPATDLDKLNEKNAFEPKTGGRSCNALSDEIQFGSGGGRFRKGINGEQVLCGFPGRTDTNGNLYLADTFMKGGHDRPGHRRAVERSWALGNFRAAVDCYANQVRKEIVAGKIKVKSPSCRALADDVAALSQMDQASANSATEVLILQNKLNPDYKGSINCAKDPESCKVANLCSQPDIVASMKAVPDFCTGNGKDEKGNEVGLKDLANHQIATCQLASARTAIEAATARLALCEIYGRAQMGHDKVYYGRGTGDDSAFAKFWNNWLSKGNPTPEYASVPGYTSSPRCDAKARKAARCSKRSKSKAKNCAKNSMNSCYKDHELKMHQIFLQHHFPADGGACTTQNTAPRSPLSLPAQDPALEGLLFVLGSLLRRRRARTSLSQKNLTLLGQLAPVGIAAILIFSWAGEGAKGGGNGSLNTGPNELKQQTPIATIPKIDNLNGAQQAVASAGKGFSNASKLAKDNKTTGAVVSAAKSGKFDASTVKRSGGEDSSGKDNLSGLLGKSGSGQGSGGGQGGSPTGTSGSGLSGSGAGDTGVSSTGVGGPTEESSSAGQYAAGGGGGAGGGKAGKQGFDNPFAAFGNKGSGEESLTGNAAKVFGKGSDVNPMGSQDPADYFARIGALESIFKRVERRYQEKQQTWISLDAAEQLRALQNMSASKAKAKP